MKLREAIDNYEIFSIRQKVRNKKGKIEEHEIQLVDIGNLDVEGKIGIRDLNNDYQQPMDRLVFVLKEVEEEKENSICATCKLNNYCPINHKPSLQCPYVDFEEEVEENE